jgi:phage terminase large subunit-like protein
MAKSLMEQISLMTPEQQALALSGMDPDALLWDWSVWGRPEQQEPEGDWAIWAYIAGRGAG